MSSKDTDHLVWKGNPAARRHDSHERGEHTAGGSARTVKVRAPSAAWWNAAFGGRDAPAVRAASAPSPSLPYSLERKSYDTLTVLVPGTFAPLGPLPTWYLPSAGAPSLFDYLRDAVFPGEDLYVHRWNSWGLTPAARHRRRVDAAKRLLRDLQNVRVNVLRIIGHSHGANVAAMTTRNDLVRRRRGLHVDTLVLLSPAVDPHENCVGYYPDMEQVGDLSVPLEHRRFFTFHPVSDRILASDWAQNYRHTELARHETLRDAIAPNNHWSSTFPDVWETAANQLADLVRRRRSPASTAPARWPPTTALVGLRRR